MKRPGLFDHHVQGVAPLAGAWIETAGVTIQNSSGAVAPLAGAWIETA